MSRTQPPTRTTAVGRGAVEIIGIDDCKRSTHDRFRRQHRLPGPPRLPAARRRRIRWRQVTEFLKHIGHLHLPLQPAANGRAKILFNVPPEHEHHAAKTRPARIVGGVFDDEFAARADRGDLLQAAETAAHACRKDHKIIAHGRRIPQPEARRQPILQPPDPENNIDLAGRTH